MTNNSAGSLAFGSVSGGFGRVTDRQVVLARPGTSSRRPELAERRIALVYSTQFASRRPAVIK